MLTHDETAVTNATATATYGYRDADDRDRARRAARKAAKKVGADAPAEDAVLPVRVAFAWRWNATEDAFFARTLVLWSGVVACAGLLVVTLLDSSYDDADIGSGSSSDDDDKKKPSRDRRRASGSDDDRPPHRVRKRY